MVYTVLEFLLLVISQRFHRTFAGKKGISSCAYPNSFFAWPFGIRVNLSYLNFATSANRSEPIKNRYLISGWYLKTKRI